MLTLVPQIVPVPLDEPSGSLNCGPATGATLVIHATGGLRRPTAADVRARCLEPNGRRDVVGGTNLRQVADAMHSGWGVPMDVVTPADYAAFRRRMQREPLTAASVSISYSALAGTHAYASRSGFRGNHQIVVTWVGGTAPWEMVDPLADGERGVPLAPLRISDALLRKAAGALVLTARINGRRVSWPLGGGSIYVGFVRGPAAPQPSKYAIRFTPGAFHVYAVQGGVAITRTSQQFTRRTSAPCDAPRAIPFPNSDAPTKMLARITKGSLAGRYVEPGRAHVELVSL